jgi:phosphoribosylformylglycinamidine synthase
VKARVLIRPKEGILDPQGKAVERALPMVELEAGSAEELPELCEKLLANPLIEDFEIQVL